MKLFGLKTCDTCRKALKALDGAGISCEFVDVRKKGVPRDVIDAAFQNFDKALVNRSSTSWRSLTEQDKAADPVELLQAHPTVMKRPLIVDGDTMSLGWKADAQTVWLR